MCCRGLLAVQGRHMASPGFIACIVSWGLLLEDKKLTVTLLSAKVMLKATQKG